jgi:hypothetical protein
MASLHADLLAIREKSGFSIADIHAKTKTPVEVIQEIEKGSIFEKSDRQKTYVRSFIRTYAKAIGIKDEDMIRALDAFEAGGYTGGLRKKYIPETTHADLEDQDEGFDAVAIKDITSDNEDTGIVRPGPTSTIGSDEFSRPDPSRLHNRVTPPPPKLDTVDWAKYSDGFTVISSPIFKYFLILLAGVIILITVYFSYDYLTIWQNTDTENERSAALTGQNEPNELIVIPPDGFTDGTLDDTTLATESVAPPTLPDTLLIIVYATSGKLEPIRVTSDINGIRSPYWIEQNEAMRFDFLNQIDIQGPTDRFILLINGHVITDLDSASRGINELRITRDFLLLKPELFNQPAPPLPEGLNEPRVIRDRPLF